MRFRIRMLRRSINIRGPPFLLSGRAFSVSSTTLPPVRFGTYLTKYGVNMNKLAEDNKFDPVIGRDDEINRVIEILSRRTKNNPCLIGEPGVGKSAIVEGLASRIVSGNVPSIFRDKVVISIDLPGMLAGASFRGEFEDRMKGVLKDIESLKDRAILYFDEIHSIAEAGASQGALSCSDILKPPLARGVLRCIGTTTTEEYRKNIEKDAALARRFQAIVVQEPTEEEAIQILKGLAPRYESYHRIRISDEAIVSAVKFSKKYITERKLPDKAIDLMDEGSARKYISLAGGPVHGSVSSPETGVDRAASSNTLRTRFTAPVLDQTPAPVAPAVVPTPSSPPAPVAVSEPVLPSTQEPLGTLTGEDIAAIVSRATGIPVGRLVEKEKEGLLKLEHKMQSRIVGQDEALQMICKCIRISRAGLRHHDRPLGVFLLLGPTGVGKTELSKALTELIFHDVNAMTRVDMSEYMEKFAVSRLIGAPPGYVGYEEGGILTEAVRRRPYQVILLDEFEKAHKDVSNLLLQVFDEGRLTDSLGRVVDFRNTVIVLTSNLGTKTIYSSAFANTTGEVSAASTPLTEEEQRSKRATVAMEIVRSYFAPEFINRLDEVVVFNALTQSSLHEISRMQIEKAKLLLAEHYNVKLQVSEQAIHWFGVYGFNQVQYGARPLKRFIQSNLFDTLAMLLLEDKVGNGEDIYVTVRVDWDAMESTVRDAWRERLHGHEDLHDALFLRGFTLVHEEPRRQPLPGSSDAVPSSTEGEVSLLWGYWRRSL